MNKAELIGAVADKTDLTRKDADKLVNAVLDTITETLAAGDKVQLVGFGVFEAKKRMVRKGLPFGAAKPEHPQLEETTTLQFRAGKFLKEAVNR